MSALTHRISQYSSSNRPMKMYSKEGADFQEWATKKFIEANMQKGSITHESIGELVHEINNDITTVEQAKLRFLSNLENRL